LIPKKLDIQIKIPIPMKIYFSVYKEKNISNKTKEEATLIHRAQNTFIFTRYPIKTPSKESAHKISNQSAYSKIDFLFFEYNQKITNTMKKNILPNTGNNFSPPTA
jgi:hypothetical protein